MKALLVRIGVDQTFGAWNAPVDAGGRFVYVPIPEKRGTLFHPGLERRYGEVLPSLESFCDTHRRDLFDDLRFPRSLLQHAMHLDPNFDMLTYGDDGARRGARIREMKQGDLLVFYGGLRPIQDCEHKLIYALLGLYVVEEILLATGMPAKCWHENAHVRKRTRRPTDIVVRAKPKLSGRFERCIPIGEWREGAYRVRKDVLNAWGGLTVRDGYIQRSAVPPRFHKPTRFLNWLDKQAVHFIPGNNCHHIEPRVRANEHSRFAQTNCVMPGMATGATSIGPQS